MFKHPLRIKNQGTVKKSERKALFDHLSQHFASFRQPDNQSILFPLNEDIKTLKVETSRPPLSGPAKNQKDSSPCVFLIYCSAKLQPLFYAFDIPSGDLANKGFRTVILPTVYALWKCPDLFSLTFFTVPDVIVKLQAGGDLMLAGVAFPDATRDHLQNELSAASFPYGAVVPFAAKSPVAVGSVVMEMSQVRLRLQPGGELKGRLLKVLHIIGDELWSLGDKSFPPVESTPSVSGSPIRKPDVAEAQEADPEQAQCGTSNSVLSGAFSDNVCREISEESMDLLFRRALLITLKSKARDSDFPMLASTLNGHLMSIGRKVTSQSMDIKRTSYKKFAKFLDDMDAEGILAVSKIKEGVQAVSSVSWKHPAFLDVEVILEDRPEKSVTIRVPHSVRQVYIVNGKTAPFFSAINPEMKKGYEFRTTDAVREVLSSYIRMNNLTSKTDSKIINLDKTLMEMILNKGVKFQGEWPLKWGEVFDGVLKEMTGSHEVVFTNGGSVELKGKLVPIDVKVEKKAGNKLVTVMRNLEGLGMDPNEVARELQQVVGATVGVREEGGSINISQTVTVQGDQTKLLDKFFFQTLCMPKKFVTGLEKPGKKG